MKEIILIAFLFSFFIRGNAQLKDNIPTEIWEKQEQRCFDKKVKMKSFYFNGILNSETHYNDTTYTVIMYAYNDEKDSLIRKIRSITTYSRDENIALSKDSFNHKNNLIFRYRMIRQNGLLYCKQITYNIYERDFCGNQTLVDSMEVCYLCDKQPGIIIKDSSIRRYSQNRFCGADYVYEIDTITNLPIKFTAKSSDGVASYIEIFNESGKPILRESYINNTLLAKEIDEYLRDTLNIKQQLYYGDMLVHESGKEVKNDTLVLSEYFKYFSDPKIVYRVQNDYLPYGKTPFRCAALRDSAIASEKQEYDVNDFPILVPDEPTTVFKTGKKYYTAINQYDEKDRLTEQYGTNYAGYWLKKETQYYDDSTVSINYVARTDKKQYYDNPEISPIAYQYHTTGLVEIAWNKNKKRLTIDTSHLLKTLYHYKNNGDTVVTKYSLKIDTALVSTLWGYDRKLRKKYKQNWSGNDLSTKYEENFYYDTLARLLIYENLYKGILKEKREYKYDEYGDYSFKKEYYALSDDVNKLNEIKKYVKYYDSAKRILKKEIYSERLTYKNDSLVSCKADTSIQIIYYDDSNIQKIESGTKYDINKTIIFSYNSIGLITSISYIAHDNNRNGEMTYKYVFY